MMNNFQCKADGDVLDIRIFEPIGDWFGMVSATMVSDVLDENKGIETINLHINSPGGSVFDGLAIYNSLKNHPAKVNVYVDGIAASAASVIAMAADSITMNDGSMMMIHNASGLTMGTAAEHTKQANVLGKIDGSLADIYAKRTGGDTETIAELMNEETWMSAQDAVDDGFADSVAGDNAASATAHFDLTMFTNVPRDVAERFGLRDKPQTPPEQTNMKPEDFRAKHEDAVNDWINEGEVAGYATAKTDLSELLVACGDDKSAAFEAFIAGQSVQDAKDARSQSLADKLAAAESRAIAAEAKAKELENGVDAISIDPQSSIDNQSPSEDDEKKARVQAKAEKITNEYARNAYIASVGLDPADFKFN